MVEQDKTPNRIWDGLTNQARTHPNTKSPVNFRATDKSSPPSLVGLLHRLLWLDSSNHPPPRVVHAEGRARTRRQSHTQHGTVQYTARGRIYRTPRFRTRARMHPLPPPPPVALHKPSTVHAHSCTNTHVQCNGDNQYSIPKVMIKATQLPGPRTPEEEEKGIVEKNDAIGLSYPTQHRP